MEEPQKKKPTLKHILLVVLFAILLLPVGFICGVGLSRGAILASDYFGPMLEKMTIPKFAFGNEPSVDELPPLIEPTSPADRTISVRAIAEVVPKEGKYVAADLVAMKLYLYENGAEVAVYPILTKGRPGSPFETPSGEYELRTKTEKHFSSIGKVYLPYSMQFYGNYFVHGWPYYEDGTPVATSYSGGCIRLSTEDAQKVFEFAEIGTGIYVYDADPEAPSESLALAQVPLPEVSAATYLVADIDTGDVFLEKGAKDARPIASITKLMSGLVANEIISYDKKLFVFRGILEHPQDSNDVFAEYFTVGDLFYPLLMESNNAVANSIATYYGEKGFVRWMNHTADALHMRSTTFADASGIAPENVSSAEDLYRLSVYLTTKKSFLWKISRTEAKSLTGGAGDTFSFTNFNGFAGESSFIGGKVGETTAAKQTMLSVFSLEHEGVKRRVAIVVLGSNDHIGDTRKLHEWFGTSVAKADQARVTACVSCAVSTTFRKIDR